MTVSRAIFHARLYGAGTGAGSPTGVVGQTGAEITSVTDTGTGDVTARFDGSGVGLSASTILPQATVRSDGGGALYVVSITPDTTFVRMICRTDNGSASVTDPTEYQLSVYRVT